jgi:uncharacterized protein YerC
MTKFDSIQERIKVVKMRLKGATYKEIHSATGHAEKYVNNLCQESLWTKFQHTFDLKKFEIFFFFKIIN